MKRFKILILSMLLIPALMMGSGCQTIKDNPRTAGGTAGGAALGALAGGIIGHQTGHRGAGAVIGALGGAALGATIGRQMDNQAKLYDRIEGLEVEMRNAQESQYQAPQWQPEYEQMKAAQPPHLNLRLSNDVLFQRGSAVLAEGARTKLGEIAQIMRDHPNSQIRIKGYASSEGEEQMNLELSRRRAAIVADTLVSLGINPTRIVQVAGFGESFPIASNETEAGRAMNRRVEIEIFPAEEVR